jgi:hypothetical protein
LIEKQNFFILTLSVAFFFSIVALSVLGVDQLAVYMSVITLIYLASTLVFRIRFRAFDFLAIVLLAVFIVAIASQVI